MTKSTVLGVDRYPRGWVGALVAASGVPALRVHRSLAALLNDAPGAECVAVDMPIGLQSSGVREADLAARLFVGPRRSSVFMTPPLGVLEAGSFEEANKVAPTLMDGAKVSRQAWALAETIFEVAKLAELDDRIIELHPEVSFRAMAGHDIPFSKHSWNGITLRRAALAAHGLVLPNTLGECGEVPAADILDALAAAWSVRRFAGGQAYALPLTARPGHRGAISY